MIINPSKTKCNFLLVNLRLLLEISNEATFNFRPHRNVKTKAILNFDSKLYNSQGDEFIMDFKKICEPYKKEAYEFLLKDLAINSVYDPSTITSEAPYGKGVFKCFELLKEWAIDNGF